MVARDAAEGLRARLLLAEDKQAAAAALEEVQRLEASVGLIGGSPFFSQGYERYLYAGLLDSLGRTDDALWWYGSFEHNSIFDLVYLAPSHLRRAEIYARVGRPKEAAEHYGRAVALWQGGDVEFLSQLGQTKERLRRPDPEVLGSIGP
jgi:tetratricopeptide (TPR) repeat protein